MKVSISAKTDIGRKRDNNEDAFVLCPDLSSPNWHQQHTEGYIPLGELGALLVVADGMGGANAGEVASATAIDTIKETFSAAALQHIAATDETAIQFLCQVVGKADAAINAHMFDHPDTAGMGTTIVMLWLMPQKAYVAWCGDSRCYLYSTAQGLKALTKDHSYVQQLVDDGIITEQEAFQHPENNIITRGLGDFDNQAQPDIVITPVCAGDTFLLCTDGLCGYCTNEQIGRAMDDAHADTNRTADRLLHMALNAGGEDNICIAVTTILADDDPQAQSSSRIKSFFKNIFG
jgi:protein phosphatase